MTEIEYQEFVRHCPYDAITDMYFIQQEINQPYFRFIVVMTMNM